MATVIGSIIVFGLLAFLVVRQVRAVKKGGGCACGCASCSKTPKA
ncbi:MAG: hypothetical protein Ta2G_20390 [Termitinemataceae bacterium]|nr:MAG: hypothetical protein Ta2G_20390 [Termitinemataceae bacterium]